MSMWELNLCDELLGMSLSTLGRFIFPYIVQMNFKNLWFIFDEEYFGAFGGMNNAEYKAGFEGLTTDTFTGEQAMIATATMTSNAVKQSTEDAFATFNAIKGGNW